MRGNLIKGPFLVMIVAGEYPEAHGYAPLRAYAQPILSGQRFIPVDSEFERSVLRHPDTSQLLTLVAHRDVPHDPFDESRTGLDHLAFATRSAEDVDTWRRWLQTQGVGCSEVKDGALPGSRLITFRDPDGIQVECYFSP